MCDKPNRIVIELNCGHITEVRADRPDEVTIILHDPIFSVTRYGCLISGAVYGVGGYPIEPLAVVTDGQAVEYEVTA